MTYDFHAIAHPPNNWKLAGINEVRRSLPGIGSFTGSQFEAKTRLQCSDFEYEWHPGRNQSQGLACDRDDVPMFATDYLLEVEYGLSYPTGLSSKHSMPSISWHSFCLLKECACCPCTGPGLVSAVKKL